MLSLAFWLLTALGLFWLAVWLIVAALAAFPAVREEQPGMLLFATCGVIVSGAWIVVVRIVERVVG